MFEDDPLLAQLLTADVWSDCAATPGGRLLYELRHGWKDGTTHVAFEPLELIERLAALVPPPRFHTLSFAPPDTTLVWPSSTQESSTTVDEASSSRTSRPSRYYSWSELMRRVFQVDVLCCPRCNAGPMRILAAIHPPTTTEAILKSLGLPTRAAPRELIFNVAFLIWAMMATKKNWLAGNRFHLYLIAYGIFRFAHEFLRDDQRFIGPIGGYHLIALGMVVFGLVRYLQRRRLSCPVPIQGELHRAC